MQFWKVRYWVSDVIKTADQRLEIFLDEHFWLPILIACVVYSLVIVIVELLW